MPEQNAANEIWWGTHPDTPREPVQPQANQIADFEGDLHRYYQMLAENKKEKLPETEEEDVAKNLINKFLVGADPEFIAVAPPKKVMNVARLLEQTGEVGYDHNGWVLELRPKPSRDCMTVLKRMQKLLLEDKRLDPVKKYIWRGGVLTGRLDDDVQRTLGGHVHISGKPEGMMIPAMDKFTEWLECLDILPQKECETRRAEGKDIAWGCHRSNGSHWEYRGMPSWLYDPRLALICMTGIKLIAADAETWYKGLANGKPSIPRLQTAFFKHATIGMIDKNAEISVDLLKDVVGLNVNSNLQETWKTIPED